MNNVQHDALLEQALDLRAARTLCRDGWSCEQINAVLKNASITHQEFATIQTQSRDLDKLQQVFGPPIESLYTDHTEPDQSEIDFLNRGPDAAAEVLREKGWNGYEIGLVIQDSMFLDLDEPQLAPPHATYGSAAPTVSAAFPTQDRNGYALGHPEGRFASIPVIPLTDERPYPQRKSSRRSLTRDAFTLSFMAAFALVLVFTLL
ncbi:hypothetical protein [Leptothoe spongobia]|uniref:Uncharacterized protein n=1 Tax=Leptothoe spongobia TAU-MAC 1115 TaxID=1967444 RepID=A0A947GLD7_9CYAN|nr:hypothetical protein [Leptothoe spongobia]MBT9317142.1 hypothetical protein [Leptothoe spongobia TAU-MAC 1115]